MFVHRSQLSKARQAFMSDFRKDALIDREALEFFNTHVDIIKALVKELHMHSSDSDADVDPDGKEVPTTRRRINAVLYRTVFATGAIRKIDDCLLRTANANGHRSGVPRVPHDQFHPHDTMKAATASVSYLNSKQAGYIWNAFASASDRNQCVDADNLVSNVRCYPGGLFKDYACAGPPGTETPAWSTSITSPSTDYSALFLAEMGRPPKPKPTMAPTPIAAANPTVIITMRMLVYDTQRCVTTTCNDMLSQYSCEYVAHDTVILSVACIYLICGLL